MSSLLNIIVNCLGISRVYEIESVLIHRSLDGCG